jgi:hypothetical protein
MYHTDLYSVNKNPLKSKKLFAPTWHMIENNRQKPTWYSKGAFAKQGFITQVLRLKTEVFHKSSTFNLSRFPFFHRLPPATVNSAI